MLMNINNIWRMFHLKLPVIPEHSMTKCMRYNDVRMSATASQGTSLTIVNSTVYSRRRWNITSNLGATGLCAGNWPVTGEFPAQRTSNAENVSIWWRHHGLAAITGTNIGVWNVYSLVVLNFACSIFPHNEPRHRRCYQFTHGHDMNMCFVILSFYKSPFLRWKYIYFNHSPRQRIG